MKLLLKALRVSLVLLLICGIIYPLSMTALSQLLFHKQANGSIAMYNGKPVGSELLGQAFTDTRFFHGRVSSINYNTYTAADTVPDQNGKIAYTGVASGSSNLAPSNPALVQRVKSDIDAFLKANPTVKKEDIPTDLLTNSGSGLDPDISPEAAAIQIPAIVVATGLSQAEIERVVRDNTKGRTLGIFGEARVNVLNTNLEIAKLLKLA